MFKIIIVANPHTDLTSLNLEDLKPNLVSQQQLNHTGSQLRPELKYYAFFINFNFKLYNLVFF